MGDETHVVHQEFDTGTSDGYGTLESVYWLSVASKIVGYRREQTVSGNSGLLANVVKQETTGSCEMC